MSVPTGAFSASFYATIGDVPSQADATVTATFAGTTVSKVLTAVPNVVTSVIVAPTATLGGSLTLVRGTVTVAATPVSDLVVSLSSDSPCATPANSTVTIPAGRAAAYFTVISHDVSASAVANLSASRMGTSRSAALTVNPITLTGFTISPGTVKGGSITVVKGTVTLSVAPATDFVVSLSSDTPAAASVPASVTVRAGARTAQFAITTYAVPSTIAVPIHATFHGTTLSVTLNVTH